MSQNDVEKIKERLGIEEVVGSYIKLEKAGKNLKARCPFHNEKTPSFVLSPDRDNYYCFGCGAKGDIFSFVQEFESLDFMGAMKLLADRAGIDLKPVSRESKEKYDKLRSIMDLATKFFHIHLSKNEKALKYVGDRGISVESIKEWKIGFAPVGWENLMNFLKKQGFKESEIEEAGLIKKGDKGKYYDRFRSRIIFPIFDVGGRPVAFTGRIFEGKDDEAKYLNSPETPLFEKSKILHGFDKAKQAIRRNDFAILVEGQMDLVMCHQAGYKNAVASSGTALTKDQLQIISRISEKMVIAYDSDSAGFKASEKAWQLALSMGMDVKIAPIPEGEDPADVILNDIEKWKDIIKDSRHIIEIFVEKILKENPDDRDKGKIVSAQIIPYLSQIHSKIDQSYFIKYVAEKMNLSEESVISEIKEYSVDNKEEVKTETKQPEPFVARNSSIKLEKQLFGLLFWQETVENSSVNVEETLVKIKEIVGENYEVLLNDISAEKENLIFLSEEVYGELSKNSGLESTISEFLENLEIKYLSAERDNLKKLLKQAEESKDEEAQDKYFKEIDAISKKIGNRDT